MNIVDVHARSLNILLSDSPQEAPNYNQPEYLYANMTTARVIGKGTQSGRATVDFVFEDEKGQKYVAMLTGGLIENLAAAIRGMNIRNGVG